MAVGFLVYEISISIVLSRLRETRRVIARVVLVALILTLWVVFIIVVVYKESFNISINVFLLFI